MGDESLDVVLRCRGETSTIVRMRLLSHAALAMWILGCTRPGTDACATSRDCRTPDVCIDSRCVPPIDVGGLDAGRDDAGLADVGLADARLADTGLADTGGATDAGVDTGALDSGAIDSGTIDSGTDSGTGDAGTACLPMTSWGVVDGSTADAYGDEFGRQVLELTLCTVPPLGDTLDLQFRARITAPGTEFPWDIFGTYVAVNGVGDYRDTLMTWSYVTVMGPAFADYVMRLPADINRDGRVDWVVGRNTLEISTWSAYNDRPSSAGLDALLLVP